MNVNTEVEVEWADLDENPEFIGQVLDVIQDRLDEKLDQRGLVADGEVRVSIDAGSTELLAVCRAQMKARPAAGFTCRAGEDTER